MVIKSGKRYRLKATGEIGRLEGSPLHDPAAQDTETSILWIPDFGELAERWEYVKPADLMPA